jgi:hypothetical protein
VHSATGLTVSAQFVIFTHLQVKVLADNLGELRVRLLARAVRVDKDGQGLGDTNGVRELHQDTSRKTSCDEGLGNPARSVGGGPVDLGEVLSAESTTTAGSPASVGVNDNLSACDTGVTLGTADHETTRGLDVVDGLVIEEVGGDDLLDDLFENLLPEVLGGNLLSVLSGDDDSIDTQGCNSAPLLLVLDSDLSLGVWAEPSAGAIAAGGRHGKVELVSEHEGEGHELGGLVGCVAEHDTLITSSVVFEVSVVKTLGNVRRLLLNCDKDVAGLVVKALLARVVSNVLDSITNDLLVVNLGLCGNLTKDHDHARLGCSFAGNFGVGVLSEAGIEDGIRDLVTDLVRVAFSDRFAVRKRALSCQSKLGTSDQGSLKHVALHARGEEEVTLRESGSGTVCRDHLDELDERVECGMKKEGCL